MHANSIKAIVSQAQRCARYLRETKLAGRLPLSWLVMVLVGLVALIAGNETRVSLQSTRSPEPTPLSRIFDVHAPSNRHVEVEGFLLPEVRLSSALGSSFRYVAMIAEPPHVLLIRYPSDLRPGRPRVVTVSGLLRPPERGVVQKLDSVGWTLAGVPVERRYVLIPGLSPRPAWLTGTIAAVFVGMLCFLIYDEVRSRFGSRNRLQTESRKA